MMQHLWFSFFGEICSTSATLRSPGKEPSSQQDDTEERLLEFRGNQNAHHMQSANICTGVYVKGLFEVPDNHIFHPCLFLGEDLRSKRVGNKRK